MTLRIVLYQETPELATSSTKLCAGLHDALAEFATPITQITIT